MLLGPCRKIYSSIHVYSPSIFIDSAWDVVLKYAKTLDTEENKSTFHDSWDEASLVAIIGKQREKIK